MDHGPRPSPPGSRYKPTDLIANSALFEGFVRADWFRNMRDDMDINCGGIVDGSDSVGAVGARVFEMLLRIASGEQAKSEILVMGEPEFAPWQLGAVM